MAHICMRRLGVFLAVFLAAFLVTAAACSSSDDNAGAANDDGTETPAVTDGPADTTDEPDPMDGPDGLSTSLQLTAVDNVFKGIQPSQGAAGMIEAPANSEMIVNLFNDGVLPHNIAFFDKAGGSVLDGGEANGAILLEAESSSVTFMTPDPGTYYFNCTVHPLEMFGDFIVK